MNVLEYLVYLEFGLLVAPLRRVPHKFQVSLSEVLLVDEELNEFEAPLHELHVAVLLPEYHLYHVLLSESEQHLLLTQATLHTVVLGLDLLVDLGEAGYSLVQLLGFKQVASHVETQVTLDVLVV